MHKQRKICIIFQLVFIIILAACNKQADYNAELFTAVRKGTLASVSELVKKGADINYRNKYGVTPLQLAASFKKDKIVAFLLENGAKVDSVNQEGWTALHFAVRANNKQITKMLLDYKAPIDAESTKPFYGFRQETSALDIAQRNKNNEIVQMLESAKKSHSKNK